MADYKRYQAFCSVPQCSRRFEADTPEEAIEQAFEHERIMAESLKQGTVDRWHRDVKPSVEEHK